MKLPVLIVNFKIYERGTGKKALEISKVCEKVSKDSGANIIVTPQYSDLRLISENIEVPVFSQHLEPVSYGSNTGSVLPEAVHEAGASGTLLNHSEKRISLEKIRKGIERAESLDMETVVCVQSPEEAMEVAEVGPDYIAYEPPELIGGETSVSGAKPEIVRETVGHVKSVNKDVEVLTGAGIKTGEDVKKALELGTKGVLIASGVVKASNCKKALKDLVKGFE